MSQKECTYLDDCPIFEHLYSEGARELIKSLYCHKNNQHCHRFHLAEAGDAVPLQLMPDGSNL